MYFLTVPVMNMIIFEMCINMKKSHINFTIILHNVSYNTCNSDY